MALTPTIIDGNWDSVRKAIQLLSSNLRLGYQSNPTFNSVTLGSLTASRLIASDANKVIVSSDLANWVSGTANEIEVTDYGDGTIILGLIDPLIVAKGGTGAATLTDHSLLVGSGTDAITVLGAATNGQLPIGSTGADPVLAALTGTSNQITVTNGAGSITLSTPQDINTTSSVQFGSLNVEDTTDVQTTINSYLTLYTNQSSAFTYAYSAQIAAINSGTGNITGNLTGLLCKVIENNTGTIATGRAATFQVQNLSTGNFTEAKVLDISAPYFTSTGGVGTLYGLYIGEQNHANVTTPYGIYQVGSDDVNYFAGLIKTANVQPLADDTYYLGKNDDDSPLAYKGLILKDQTDGKYYRIQLDNGAVSVIDLTD